MAVAKQIIKPILAAVGASAFGSAGGVSEPVTAVLTTVLTTAGDGGQSVPLQAGTLRSGADTFGTIGLCVTAPFNDVLVYANGTGLTFTDGNGNDVYGRLSVAGAIWTVAYYSKIAGVETAFAMPASTSLDFEFNYIFSFDLWPGTAPIGTRARHVGPDPAAYGWRERTDPLTVTATNTLSQLTRNPTGAKAVLIVNDLPYSSAVTTPYFSVSGKTVTWNAAAAGFSLTTGDAVAATYTY